MRSYALTLAALLVLTGLTFGLSFLSLGPWGVPIALLIAAAKAVLVVLFFMHLLEQSAPARLTILVAVFVGALLIILATLDVTTRAPVGAGPSAPAAAERAGPRR